jgi:hypothetical protein
MLKTYRLRGPWLGLAFVLALPLFLLLSLPFFIGLAVLGVLSATAYRWLRKPTTRVSEIIQNTRIGPYRVRQDPKDPSIVEVLP